MEEHEKEKLEKQAQERAMMRVKTTNMVNNLLITVILITVFASVLIFLGLTYVVTILLIAMMPAILANVVEKRTGRYASKTITFFNIAGLLPQVITVAKAGDPNLIAKEMIGDPFIWTMIYGFAGFGWVMVQVIPQITFLFLLAKAEITIKNLEATRSKLIEEWGEAVTRPSNAE